MPITYLRSGIQCEFRNEKPVRWVTTKVVALHKSGGERLLEVSFCGLNAPQNGGSIRFPQYPGVCPGTVFEMWRKGSVDRWESRSNVAHHYNEECRQIYSDAWNSIESNPVSIRAIALAALNSSFSDEELPF